MNIIKDCPACGRKLRYPFDRGRVKVKCACGRTFIADPDDPETYRGASFDLSPENSGSGTQKTSRDPAQKFDFHSLIDRFMKSLYELKYDIQNYRYLPAVKRKQLLIKLMPAVIFLIILFFLLTSG